MTTATLTREEREAKLEGMGCKRKRVEDIRFTQGKGNYIDDLKLPGMLFGDFVRSQYAHARVKRIDTSKALKVPGVLAVLTAEELKGVNLALDADTGGRRADGAGRRQGAVPEPGDRFRRGRGSLCGGRRRRGGRGRIRRAPSHRRCAEGHGPGCPRTARGLGRQDLGAHGPRKHHNHIFEWAVGDKAGTAAAFASAEVKIKELISYHRTHPSPLETCQCVASFDKIKGELTVHGTFQAPHVIRTVASLISKIPEHKIHVISPDIGGGFGNKVGAYPGYICAIVASIVTGQPVKWVEDRIENLTTTSFARDYHMTTEIAATKDGKVTGLRVHT